MKNKSWRPTEDTSSGLYLGLMSGTSLDAVDVALIDWADTGQLELVATHCHFLPEHLRCAIEDLSHPGENEIDRMGELDRSLGLFFSEAAQALLANSSHAASDIIAIGSHGQTIRHQCRAVGQVMPLLQAAC